MQVMVLSHEDATVTEQMPYMAIRCQPMQVVEFWGRAAKRAPPLQAGGGGLLLVEGPAKVKFSPTHLSPPSDSAEPIARLAECVGEASRSPRAGKC